ncbi:hypothetical protein Sjap_008405 [Stephania japonica]|uniref:Protein kinase domain-containing protein n=1 Tax=Stephania japonica TaxID=461633 RepID=A0AAP0JPF3_9MAGN
MSLVGKGLTLFTRVKILRDCALALKFLHSHPDGCIVHEAIKLSSILLNNNMEVELSDLGLAKMLDYKDQPTVSVDLDASSIGYMDPEYMTTAKPTAATDIYRFGSHIASSNRKRTCQSGLPCS